MLTKRMKQVLNSDRGAAEVFPILPILVIALVIVLIIVLTLNH